MPLLLRLRSRAPRLWRVLWPLVVVLAGGLTCDSPSHPVRGIGAVALNPVLRMDAELSAFANLSITHARILLIRPPSDTLARGTFPFSPDDDQISASLSVEVDGTEELTAVIELLSGSLVMFTGTQLVTVTAGQESPVTEDVPLDYIGPGSGIASINLMADTTALIGAVFTLRTAPLDSSGNPVTQYYISWSTSDPANRTINGDGELAVGGTVGIFRVYAETPSGIRDSATVTVTAVPVQPAAITMSLPGGGFNIGAGRTVPLQVQLGQAAPAAGLLVTIASDSGRVTVAPPGTIAFLSGETSRTINVTGHASDFGVGRLRASAAGHTPDTLFVGVIPNVITLAAVSVAVGGTANMVITLSTPAPAGGLTVTLTSVDPGIATVTASVNIAAGATGANATVTGVANGATSITATAPGYLDGGNIVTVGTSPTSLTRTDGDNQTAYINDTTAVRPQVRVLDGGGAPVANVIVGFTVTGGGGSITGTTGGLTDAAGFLRLPSTWRLGGTPGANTLTAVLPAFPAIPAVVFNATAQLPPPAIVLSVFGSNVVGQARTGTLNVRLLVAPAGALAVNLTTTRAGLLRIGSYGSENGTVNFTGGATDTLRTITLFGDSSVTGIDTIIATATGYAPDTLAVPVSLNLISLPTTLNVAFGQNATLPVNLSLPAPAGGVDVAIASSNPSIVQVLTPTVNVPAGQQVANATVQGLAIGAVTVTATNPNYAPDDAAVSVTARLNIVQASTAPNQSFGTSITIQLESGGSPVSAPAGGVPLTFTSRNAACFAAPAGRVIDAGLVSTTAPVVYSGPAAAPCTGQLVVTGPPGFDADSLTVNMAATPAIAIGATANIASGLQRGFTGTLGSSLHGGTTVRVQSSDPARVLVSRNSTTAGSAFVDVPVTIGGTGFSYFIQTIEGLTADTLPVTATAPGFTPGTVQVRVWQPVFDIIGLNGSGSTFDLDDPFQLRTGTPASPTGGIATEDELRAGGPGVTFNIINDVPAPGDLVTTALTADSVTVALAPSLSRTPTTVAAGGVAFRYLAPGTAAIRAHAGGFRLIATLPVNVTAPVLTIPATMNLGSGLQRNNSASIDGPAPAGGLPVTFALAETGVARLALNGSSAGVDTLVVNIAAGGTTAPFFVQALEGVVADTVLIVASAPGLAPDTMALRVWQPVFDIIGLNTTATTLAADDPFQTRIGTPISPTGGIATEDELRFGSPGLIFTVINDTAAVADLVTTALTGDTVQTTMAAVNARSPISVAAGGVALRYTAGGVTRVQASAPNARSLNTVTVTVSQPSVTAPGTTNLGSGLQRNTAVSLSNPAPAGGVTVTIAPAERGVFLLAPNATTVGSDTLQVTIAAGASSAPFYIQALEGVLADTVQVVFSTPGFRPDTTFIRVWQAVYDIIGLNTTATTLTADDPFQVRFGTPTSPTGGIATEDELRFGGPGATVSLLSSASSTAQLVTSGASGDSVTITTAGGQARSPASVALGGVALDYQSTGTTVVSSVSADHRPISGGITVTVSAPAVTISSSTVGASLQNNQGGSLSAPAPAGVEIVVKSQNPGIVRIAPNATTPGTDSIILTPAVGATGFAYYVQGVAGQTGAVGVIARATGYVDDNATVTVAQPAMDIIGLNASGQAGVTADDVFQIRTGLPNGTLTAMSLEQEISAAVTSGVTATITSSNATVGPLVTTALTGSPVTVVIGPNLARSPGTVAAGGVALRYGAAGSSTVSVTIPGFATITTAAATVTVNP